MTDLTDEQIDAMRAKFFAGTLNGIIFAELIVLAKQAKEANRLERELAQKDKRLEEAEALLLAIIEAGMCVSVDAELEFHEALEPLLFWKKRYDARKQALTFKLRPGEPSNPRAWLGIAPLVRAKRFPAGDLCRITDETKWPTWLLLDWAECLRSDPDANWRRVLLPMLLEEAKRRGRGGWCHDH